MQGQPQPAGGAYVSTHSAPAQAQAAPSALDDTAAGRVINPVPVAPRAPPNRLAPILVGLVAVLLLGGAAGAWVVMGKRSRGDAAQAASASAAPATSPTESASAAPTDSASAAPTDSASAAPADSAAASADPSAGADGGAPGGESTLACDPECDEIRVDDKPIELGKPVDIAPGKHTILATKAGYLVVKEAVVVKAGQKLERTFKLKEKPTAASATTGSLPAGPSKPCGKFLKRGAGCK